MMKKQLTVGEAIGFAITILALVITSWVTMSKEVARHDERIKSLENRDRETKDMLQKILDGQQEILIKMENKVDRK